MTLLHYFKKITFILLLVFLLMSISSQAADRVVINITGRVIASPCTVDNKGLYNVDLGSNIPSNMFNTPASGADWIPFDITLSDCPLGTSSVTATFTGTPDSDDPTTYANTNGSEFAQRVSIELQDTTGANLGNSKSLTKNVALNATVKFPLRARAYSKKGGVTAGKISTQVLMSLTYN
ncbi:MAG: fimbrial protein [Hafnia sp.]